MEIINNPIEVSYKNIDTSKDLYFITTSYKKLKNIKPKSYSQIKEIYGNYNLERVVKKDKVYRGDFLNHPTNVSFNYATIAGFSKELSFENLFDVEYYTYYFKMTLEEIKKCTYSVEYNNDERNILTGVNGMTASIKEFINDVSSNIKEVNVVVPFKIKPIYCLPPTNKRKYYFCSKKELSEVEKWQLVSSYKEDAISFIAPWKKEDLVYTEHDSSSLRGRPPNNILFRQSAKKPKDFKFYLYEIENVKTYSTKNKENIHYSNRLIAEKTQKLNVTFYDSWKKEFKLK